MGKQLKATVPESFFQLREDSILIWLLDDLVDNAKVLKSNLRKGDKNCCLIVKFSTHELEVYSEPLFDGAPLIEGHKKLAG